MKHLKKILSILIVTSFIYSCSSSDAPENPEETQEPTTSKVTITTGTNIVTEPSMNGSFKLTLTKVSSSSTKVDFTIIGTATNGEDYETVANSITIPANTLSTTIPITVLEDDVSEDNETIIVTLTGTNNADVVLGSTKTATITISSNTEVFVLNPNDTTNYMVNPNATDETVALFYNLKILSKDSFIIGQQDAFNAFYDNNIGDSDIKKTTGNDPGLLGSDFMFIADDNNNGQASNWFYQQEQIITGDAIEAYDKGMVNAFCWHFREPYSGDEFYSSNIDPTDLNNAFASILPDGENHDYYIEKLDKIADVTSNMIGGDGKKVPIIFRPFHEFDGSWFWWGAAYCTPEQYIELWQFTVEYLRDTKGVNNMLFAYSPDNNFSSENSYLDRYPGDAYVDILSMDNYGDFSNQGTTGVNNANNKLKILSDLAEEKVKIAALTETGYRITSGTSPISGFFATNMYNAITQNDNKIAFMMFWNNNEDGYYTPPPNQPDTNDFIDFANKPKSVLQNNLPDMYTLPN